MNEFHQKILDSFPHCKALNMRVERAGRGEVELSMPYGEALIGTHSTGVVHGGAIYALVDTCSAAAATSHPDVLRPVATLNLRIDYMRAARAGQNLRVKAKCYHATKTVAFVRSEAFDEDDKHPVASATGIFTTL